MIATAATSSREGAALDAALQAFREAPPEADFPERAEPLVAFVDAHPRSPWRAAVLTNLGLGYYRAGYFSKALSSWEQAWRAGRSARDPAARALADRAAGELARMHARLGHADELQALLDDIGKRPLSGPATELLTGAREGLWTFRNDHGKAYLCGPMALRSLLASLQADASKLALMSAQRSGPRGFDLAQLSSLADQVALPHRLIHRAPGEAIPVPSVVHWRLNHYAAIVEERDGRYLVKDPTFASGDAWLTQAAIDAEASGFFLVPKATSSDPHWRRVGLDEARSIHGMGYTTQNEPGNTLPESLGLHEPTCNRMCEANAKTMLVSLHLSDVPVGYTPPKGPPVQMRLSYHQRESGQPAVFGFFNISPKWSLSVQSWIEDDPARPGVGVVRHAGGGGSVGPLDYISYTSATGAFSPERVSRAVLVRIPASGPATAYELRQPDGTKQVFAQPDGATSAPRRMFLSQIVDPAGNALNRDPNGERGGLNLYGYPSRERELKKRLCIGALALLLVTVAFLLWQVIDQAITIDYMKQGIDGQRRACLSLLQLSDVAMELAPNQQLTSKLAEQGNVEQKGAGFLVGHIEVEQTVHGLRASRDSCR